MTPEEIRTFKGSLVVKCVKAGGYTMTRYGQYVWAEGEEKDLVVDSLPAELQANDYWIARRMCTDSNLELAQRIAAGDFEIVSQSLPRPLVKSITFQG